MGCDIHITVEVRYGDDKPWHGVNPPQGYDPHGEKYGRPDWYPGRLYSDFMVLAGVRDYGEGIKPIAMPRGKPADASALYLERTDDMLDPGYHSHSHHTVAQLRDYPRDHMSEGGCLRRVLLPELERLADELGEHNVRIVFHFDN